MYRMVKLGMMVVALGATIVGCGGGSTTSSPKSSPAVPESVSSSGTSSTDDSALLQKVALQDGDLSSGLHLQLIPGGDQVTGQVTLDICNADFPSEAMRVARLQLAAKQANTVAVNNENVAYTGKDQAAQALTEITRAVQDCPANTFLPSKVRGVPPLKFQLQLISDDQLGSVSPDHVALTGTASAQDGRSQSITQVFQRRGRIVVGIYGKDLASIKPLLAVAASRLAALSPADAGEY